MAEARIQRPRREERSMEFGTITSVVEKNHEFSEDGNQG